ncbi:MAG: outer membrane protein assembly factor BamD [Cyclobacteriaceae bacterium]|nr:outer membrane protein assembly factor BamD [Cyclobacteriaceae bacterium]
MLVLVIFSTSCSRFRRLERSEDWREKYQAGLDYYAKKDYYRTAILFEQILPIVRGLPEGEKVEFYLAYCQYYEKTYLLASNQFKTFFENYGRSSLAEEAYFMYAYSLYVAAPPENLDQRSSIEAMNAMQTYVNQYPTSKFADRANEVIAASQKKLEKKGFEGAKQYLKLKYYQAAVVSFENFQKSFPDSQYMEELTYLKVQAQYKLAQQSIISKQLERYTAAVEYYKELVDNYPKSEYLKEAERYYSYSLSELNKLKTKKS